MYSRNAVFACLVAAAFTLPVVAEHDDDAIPDTGEAILCGFQDVPATLELLPQEAGRCVGSDYQSPFLGSGSDCVECSSDVAAFFENVPLTPGQDINSIPLPPEEIPSIGPINTPPVTEDVAILEGEKDADPQKYCITLTPSGQEPVFGCVDLGPAGPLMPDFGPLELVNVTSQPVGPTPGVDEGEGGATPSERVPAVSMDFTATVVWVEDRLNGRFTSSLVDVWDPVDLDDPDEVQWWVENADKTSLSIEVVVYFDGEVQEAVSMHVPFVGQAIAATDKSLASLE